MADIATATPPAAPAAPAPVVSSDTTKTPAPDTKVIPGNTPAAAKPPAGSAIESVKKDPDPVNPDKPYIVKVDGKEIAMSKEEVIEAASKGMGADKKFKEASEMRTAAQITKKQASDFIRMLQNEETALEILANPKLGVPFRKIAEQYLSKQYELETMDPKDRELHDAKAKLAEIEAQKAKDKEAADAKQLQELTAHYSQQYEKDVMGALDASGLPKTQWTVKQMAYYMHKGLERGIELKAMDVVDFVKKDHLKHMSEMFGALDGDKLIEIMGEPNVKKVNEALLRKMKGAPPVPPQTPAASAQKPRKITKEEFRKNLTKFD